MKIIFSITLFSHSQNMWWPFINSCEMGRLLKNTEKSRYRKIHLKISICPRKFKITAKWIDFRKIPKSAAIEKYTYYYKKNFYLARKIFPYDFLFAQIFWRPSLVVRTEISGIFSLLFAKFMNIYYDSRKSRDIPTGFGGCSIPGISRDIPLALVGINKRR